MRILSALACVMILCAAARAADPMPTLEEMQKLKADQKWTELLKATTRVLALKPEASKTAERHDVWLLKAEGQIQTKLFSAASDSFESAAKEPGLAPEQKDMDLAMAMLFNKATPTGYRPPVTKENPSPESINVMDAANRPDAIKKMFDAEFADSTKALAKLKDPNMNSMAKIVKDAVELMPIERAADGGTTRIDGLLKDIAAAVVKSGTEWADKQTQEIDRLVKMADEKVTTENKQGERTTRRRGLSNADEKTIGNMITSCEQLAGSYKHLVEQMGESHANDMAALPPKIEALHDKAKTTLNSERTMKTRGP